MRSGIRKKDTPSFPFGYGFSARCRIRIDRFLHTYICCRSAHQPRDLRDMPVHTQVGLFRYGILLVLGKRRTRRLQPHPRPLLGRGRDHAVRARRFSRGAGRYCFMLGSRACIFLCFFCFFLIPFFCCRNRLFYLLLLFCFYALLDTKFNGRIIEITRDYVRIS